MSIVKDSIEELEEIFDYDWLNDDDAIDWALSDKENEDD